MTESIALAAQVASAAPSASAQAPMALTPMQQDPAETKMFANMMQGMPAVMPSAAPGPSMLGDAAKALAAKLGGGKFPTMDELQQTMLSSIDMTDPIKTMIVLTDHSMQAQAMFARLHLSSGLATAATSVFGTLLKNQQ